MAAVINIPSTTEWEREVTDLYAMHCETLVRAAMRLLDSRQLAEEAVQDAFLRFHKNAVRPRPGAEAAYLRSAVMNNARSMLRRRQRSERWRPEGPLSAASVEDVCASREADRQMRARCGALPRRQREVLVLRYWHGLSVAEVADRLAISTGSVKTHASRGRETLRRQLSHA